MKTASKTTASAAKTKVANSGPLKVCYDKKQNRFYVRIPKKKRPLYPKKKFTFELEVDALLFADEQNKKLTEDLSIRDFDDALSIVDKCREEFHYQGGLLQIAQKFYGDLKKAYTAVKEATLAEVRDLVVDHMTVEYDKKLKETGKSKLTPKQKTNMNQHIGRIRNLPLPWPTLPLTCLNDTDIRKAKIKEFRLYVETRVDFYTGLLWDTCTRRNYVTRFGVMLGYAIKQAFTPLKEDLLTRAVKFKPSFDPEILTNEDAQFFLTYLWNTDPLLYLAFVLCVWGGVRTTELKRFIYETLSSEKLAAGTIVLEASITKKDRRRTILKADVPHLFVLIGLLPPGWRQGGPTERIFSCYDIEDRLFKLWRELIGKPWPFNGARHMAASNLLVHTNPEQPDEPKIETCKRVLGHAFGNNTTIFKHYYALVQYSNTVVFYSMLPQRMTLEIKATCLWRMYTSCINWILNTRKYPNHAMKCSHNLRTDGNLFIKELKEKRPIFATAIGDVLRVEVIWPDGTQPDPIDIQCPSAFWALELQHRWRVAVYTGQGVLDFETGEVNHYEKNFGPWWKQKIWTLQNPEEIENAILAQQELTPPLSPNDPKLPPPAKRECTGLVPVAAKVGCSTDLLSSYMRLEPQAASGYSPFVGKESIPDKFKVVLQRLFPNLVLTPTNVTNRDLKRVSEGKYPFCLELYTAAPNSPQTGWHRAD